MRLQSSIDYNTRWGEKVVLRLGGKAYDMRYIYQGAWQVEIEDAAVPADRKYSYEIWNEGGLVRSEWRPHVLPSVLPEKVILRDRWNAHPSNSPFYSSLFTDVVFRRHRSKLSASAPQGNVTFVFDSAEIRPDQAVAITGSGKLFGEWKKMVLLSDEQFPQWSVTLNVEAPFEYKFVVVDRKSHEPVLWEEGGNHFFAETIPSGTLVVVGDIVPKFNTLPWRGAGTAIPVFSLRTAESFGVGEFHDIKKMVDWAVATGQNVLQLLPINDTTMTGKWQDSYPYNANTTFALHPQFIHLPDAGVKADKAYKALKEELNALPEVDYERVNNEKARLLHATFDKTGDSVLQSDDYVSFMQKNKEWLVPYAVFCCLRDEFGTPDFSKWGKMAKYTAKKVAAYAADHKKDVDYHCWVQYCLDAQLKDAVQYAHSHGVALKGDLPIGISRTSVDAWAYPELYHLDSQAGAPPDAFSVFGQNWGFPTYNWEKMSEDGFAWWKSRMHKMSEYFDAFRIDHILGFFRIWEIPMDAVHGLLGYFNPALPYSADELSEMGFDLSDGSLTTSPLDDAVIEEIFGDLAAEVKSKYIKDGKLVPAVATQRKAVEKFAGDDDKSTRLREGFLTLLDDVLFIEDPRKKGYYHPRISAQSTFSFKALDDYRKATFTNLYNDFFYHRHNEFWRDSAMSKLPSLVGSTGMLTCGEDLGMIPACVPSVMEELGILSLEIQRMPKSVTEEFADPDKYPYMCVCATGTHDTNPLRAWWEEDRDLTAKYYYSMLHGTGDVPYFCEPWVCERILTSHVKSPAMLCILPLQDWLSMDGVLRYQGNPSDERINVPAIPRYYWRYRMHLPIETLIGESAFNDRMKGMIRGAGRGV